MSTDPEDFPHEDPLPDMQASFDQLIASAPEFARLTRGYVTAFEAEGFTTGQALYMTAVSMTQTPGTAP